MAVEQNLLLGGQGTVGRGAGHEAPADAEPAGVDGEPLGPAGLRVQVDISDVTDLLAVLVEQVEADEFRNADPGVPNRFATRS